MPSTITREHPTASQTKASRKFWGILTRKERWGLSWRGWLLVTSVGLAAAYFAFLNVYPFLATTQRVDTNVLVVEGWIPKYAIRSAVEEFKAGSYQRVFTTGGPVVGKGFTIGIIAVPSPDYDSTHWWRYSEGVEEVITEGVAYLYAKFFFLAWQSD